jgi:hypothetical protein
MPRLESLCSSRPEFVWNAFFSKSSWDNTCSASRSPKTKPSDRHVTEEELDLVELAAG